MSKKQQTIPLKCQLCPYFEWDDYDEQYKCVSLFYCQLKYDDELRKQIYKIIGKMNKE